MPEQHADDEDDGKDEDHGDLPLFCRSGNEGRDLLTLGHLVPGQVQPDLTIVGIKDQLKMIKVDGADYNFAIPANQMEMIVCLWHFP